MAAAIAAVTCAFLSLSVGALRNYSLARFEQLLDGEQQRLQAILRYLDDHEEALVTAATAARGLLQVVGVVALTGALVARALSEAGPDGVGPWGWLITGAEAALLGAGLFVAACQVIPETMGERRAEPTLVRLYPILPLLYSLGLPLTWTFGGLATVALRVFNVAEVDEKEEVRHELLSAALAGENEGVIDEHIKGVIENLMEFRDADVSEVMTPRIDIISVDVKDDLDTMLEVALQHEKSRLPVTDGSLDKIVGVLIVKDLLRAVRDQGVRPESLVRKPLFVPETKRIAELLKELRTQKVHMAIVADEYGGTAGLVTIEDLIEEIIGDIDDEHDKAEVPLRRISEGLVDVDARLHIDELNEEFNIKIPEDEDVETVGGFVALRLGRIPSKGDRVDLNGTSITVTEADERRVTRVLIKLK